MENRSSAGHPAPDLACTSSRRPVCRPACLPACVLACRLVCLSVCLHVCKHACLPACCMPACLPLPACTCTSNIAMPRICSGRVGSSSTHRRYHSSSLSNSAAAHELYFFELELFSNCSTSCFSSSLSYSAAALRVISLRAQATRNFLDASLLFELELFSCCSMSCELLFELELFSTCSTSNDSSSLSYSAAALLVP